MRKGKRPSLVSYYMGYSGKGERKMKRCAMLFAALIFICFCYSALGESVSPINGFPTSPDYAAAANETLYIEAGGSVYRYDREKDESSLALSGLPPRSPLVSWGDQLYVLNMGDGMLSLLKEEDGMLALENLTQFHLEEMGKAAGVDLTLIPRAVMTDNYLCLFLYLEDDFMSRGLFAFERNTGKMTFEIVAGASEICAYRGDEVLVLCQGMGEKGHIRRYDVAKGTNDVFADIAQMDAGGLCYHPGLDTVYLAGLGSVDRAVGKGAFQTVALLRKDHDLYDGAAAAVLPDGSYVILSQNQGAEMVPAGAQKAEGVSTLDIATVAYGSDMNDNFIAEHPGVPVKATMIYGNDTEALQESIISRSGDVDLYILNASGSLFQAIREKGFFADLTQSEALKEAAAGMYPQFAEGIMKDGKLMAFPFDLTVTTPSYNPVLFEKLGMTPPATVEELLDLHIAYLKSDAGSREDVLLRDVTWNIKRDLLQAILTAYTAYYDATGEQLSFDTQAFRGLLSKLEGNLELLKALNLPPETTSFTTEGVPDMLLGQDIQLLDHNFMGREYAPLILSLDKEKEPVLMADLTVFVVNPMSPDIGLALDYIECYYAHMGKRLEIMLYPSRNEPVELDYYAGEKQALQEQAAELGGLILAAAPEEKKALQAQKEETLTALDELEKNRYEISAEDIAMYRALAPCIHLPKGENVTFYGGVSEVLRLLEQYARDEMTGDAFIKEYDRMLNMRRKENGQTE